MEMALPSWLSRRLRPQPESVSVPTVPLELCECGEPLTNGYTRCDACIEDGAEAIRRDQYEDEWNIEWDGSLYNQVTSPPLGRHRTGSRRS